MNARPGRLRIALGTGHSSEILIGRELLDTLPALLPRETTAIGLLGDSNVVALHGDAVRAALAATGLPIHVRSFPPGEAHKSRAVKAQLEDWLFDQGLGRHSCLVAIGGGISLDLVGFVAATFMRGIPHLNVPTSLLAQVDASVGGKTGVNCPHGKNLIGAFHHPRATLIDTALLATLPACEWQNGLAELVKHAFIANAELFSWCVANATSLRQPGEIDIGALVDAITVKAAIVERDADERNERAVLNFGHTLGHALEKASAHAVPHGLAVARGMLAEAELAVRKVGLPVTDCEALYDLVAALHIKVADLRTPFNELHPFLLRDKKRSGTQLRTALPERIGSMATVDGQFAIPVDEDELQRAWAASEAALAAKATSGATP